jgi:hypothetical protein
MQLAHDYPPMDADARARVELILATANCWCGGQTARLTKRVRTGQAAVQLQCLTCFDGVGGFIARRCHPHVDGYPDFNDEVAKRGIADRQRESEERVKQFHETFDAGIISLKDEYQEFLLTPQWRHLRTKVMRRSAGVCEACLEKPAAQVHHCTYDYGWLPPAWMLRAVCEECHTAIHTWEEEQRRKRRDAGAYAARYGRSAA